MKKLFLTIIFSVSILVFSSLTANALLMNYTDLLDVSQGTIVTGSSGALTGGWSSDSRNMFGGTYGSGPADLTNNTIFKDQQSAGYVHWVEWKTSALITLQSFNLVAAHDSGWDGYENRNINFRGFSTFRLFSGDGIGTWTQIFSYTTDPDSDLDYGGGVNYPAQNMLELSANITPTVAQFFRAEFVQYGNGSRNYGDSQGPRICELDGYGPAPVPLPATMLLLGPGLLCLAALKKKFIR
ncbi:hypothetical protein SAMN04489760_10384 [Syntrophus gentianae]|uniref:PEP-CTERM protein-sorting domain-containing protein n=1 Tax=Syntrophus gentianae TaxID=43775 RepID=A0A1H7V8C9_9BACT|nr:hypothetical protein [Syntrophus gentianae]SEM05284.1 hypothetical protein SAMN04489760_10384 [Syntrophus gentianae]